jgi:hypothetical protein
VLAGFGPIDQDTTKEELLGALAYRRYALGWYKVPEGGGELYGIIPVVDEAWFSSTADHQTITLREGHGSGGTLYDDDNSD